MSSFDDVPEEVHKVFEECKKAREEKELHELLACYVKDRRGSITQIKELVLPPIDHMKEVHTGKVLHSSTSITPEDVSTVFSKHVKFTRNMVGEEIAKGLAKFSQNSKYQPPTFAISHRTALSSLAAPSTSASQPPYSMPLNYFCGQTPLAHTTSMTLYMPEPIPISTISPTSATPDTTSFVPPHVPTGAAGNSATGFRYAAPQAPQTPPISHRIYQKPYPSIFFIRLHIPRVGVSLILVSLMARVLAPRGNT
jgi:hypothetical protein